MKNDSPAILSRALALSLAAAALPGCLIMARRHEDRPIYAEQVAQVKPGMTKVEATAILGAPKEIIFSNKEHDPLREHAYIFEYTAQAGTAIFFGVVNFGNLDAKKDRVVVFFDETGRIEHVASSLHGREAGYGFPFGE